MAETKAAPVSHRLAERLRKELQGEVLFDRFSRGRYSTDASHYQIEPLGVVIPRTHYDVLAAMAIAREEGRYNIRSNSVAPGIIDAGLGAEFMKTLYNEEIWETQRNTVLFYGSTGERFFKVQLEEAPRLETAAA